MNDNFNKAVLEILRTLHDLASGTCPVGFTLGLSRIPERLSSLFIAILSARQIKPHLRPIPAVIQIFHPPNWNLKIFTQPGT